MREPPAFEGRDSMAATRVREIGVYPGDEDRRKYLKHPIGRRFENWPEATPWPYDQFTYRRLIDGDIKSPEFDGRPQPVEE